MALLGVPVFGMLIAVAVIYYKKPDNMGVVFGVILFVAVQYILMMFFLLKRIESLAQKEETNSGVEKDLENIEAFEDTPESQSDSILLPEEERVFSSEKET